MYWLELAGDDDAFAAFEAQSGATGVEVLAPGLATATAVVPDRVRGLAYTRRVNELVGRTDADLRSAQVLLETAPLERPGTVAVRATDVRGTTGVDTARAERVLGQVLVNRGYSVDLDDPDHTLRVAFSRGRIPAAASADRPGIVTAHEPESGLQGTVAESTDDGGERSQRTDSGTVGGDQSVCVLGWLVTASVRDFGDRRPTDSPFFQPGGMDPLLARAVANLAGARPGRTILDPMCGTAGLLAEAGLLGATVVGSDVQAKMVSGASTNLSYHLSASDDNSNLATPGPWNVIRADATSLPLADDAVDAVVFDAPYGRQSKIEGHDLADLVAGALSEARRVADRAVVVADRSWARHAREAGWELLASFDRRVHRSLTRQVLVVEKSSSDDRL